ncbi:MAG TPA: hypothetical protein VFE15_05270 [Marmoricola sp.]|jgi:hypothetical protein|nr:hypothetical protein [Marmoricola sp.]
MDAKGTALRRTLSGLAGLLALLCVAVVTAPHLAPALAPASWTAADRITDRDASVSMAAREAALALTTYDYRSIDADVATLRRLATGMFQHDLGSYGTALSSASRRMKSVASGSIDKVGIGKIAGVAAVVDVAATKRRSDAATGSHPKTATIEYLFHLTLTRIGDHWLVSALRVAVAS